MANSVFFSKVFAEAKAAGLAAGAAAAPLPMVVAEADVLSGAALPGGKRWYVPEGACGFAWVKVRPGNSAFARWLVKSGKARAAYSGGVDIWISDHNQSVARKEAHAAAMAEALRVGLNDPKLSIYSDSRLD